RAICMKATVLADQVAVVPPSLSFDQQVAIVCERVNCTRAQARVVVAGARLGTCSEVAGFLGTAEGTVRCHYHAFFARTRCPNRNHATALVVALLWQSIVY